MKLNDIVLQFQLIEDHMRGRERRVAAEVDLDRRREPADVIAAAFFDEERRLGKVILRRDL